MRYDYRAYLTSLRNVSSGLESRHSILMMLKIDEWQRVSTVASKVSLSVSTVRYHLRNMQSDGYVEIDKETRTWRLCNVNQSELSEFLPRTKRMKSS